MKKRILSLLLALMMVVLLLPVTALAAETGIDTSALDMEYYGRYRDKGYSISVYNCGEYISDGADGGLSTRPLRRSPASGSSIPITIPMNRCTPS